MIDYVRSKCRRSSGLESLAVVSWNHEAAHESEFGPIRLSRCCERRVAGKHSGQLATFDGGLIQRKQLAELLRPLC